MISLGNRPEQLSVALVRGASFVAALQVDPGPWPDDIEIELQFRALPSSVEITTWAATVSGALAQWEQLDTAVDALLEAGRTLARLVYREADGTELVWASGSVEAL